MTEMTDYYCCINYVKFRGRIINSLAVRSIKAESDQEHSSSPATSASQI